MIYSCFEPKSGLYDYFETADRIPINADLPIPKLPQGVSGIGVPAIEAGRPMPFNARHVGQGWHARGMLINCGRTPMGDADATVATVAPLTVALVSGLLLLAAVCAVKVMR